MQNLILYLDEGLAKFELVEAVVLDFALVGGNLTKFTPGVFLDNFVRYGAHELL